MPDPRDHLDDWLAQPVRPIQPPPGTFELVRKRARRRKLTRATASAAGVAVVAAAAVLVPRVVVPHLSPGQPVAASRPTASHHRVTGPGPHPSLSTTAPAAGLPPAPGNFKVSSVTFVGASTGWVIGQAGHPGHCGPPKAFVCTSLARSDNAGQSWYGVPAPVAGAPSGGSGVSQVRFLNTSDGWVFGPELYATHDGGQTWARVDTQGMRVVSLETVSGRAFAIWARCAGIGPAFAAGCTSFRLYSSPGGADAWAPVSGVAAQATTAGIPQIGQAPSASAALVLTGGQGYLLAPDGHLYSGPASAGTGWGPVHSSGGPGVNGGSPCLPGQPQRSGEPSGALVAATGAANGLIMVCPPSHGNPATTLYHSTDGGSTWQPKGTVPGHATPRSLSGSPSGAVVLATSGGILLAPRPGGTWHAVMGASPPAPPGGFSFVGMTTAAQGVAMPSDSGAHGVWFTFDGGQSWNESAIP